MDDDAAALEAAARNHPAAIVLDLLMPEMNGFDTRTFPALIARHLGRVGLGTELG